MTMDLDIFADAEGHTLDKLAELVTLRQKYLRYETTQDAVIATVINILTSLRAATKTAPKKSRGNEFTVRQLGTSGFRRVNGKAKRVPLVGGHQVSGVYPGNWMHGLKGEGGYYEITLLNPNARPKNTKNPPRYLIMAPNLATAERFARDRVSHLLQKERGLARHALALAQAHVSNRPMTKSSVDVRVARVADSAVTVQKSGSVGDFLVRVLDGLDYSTAALKPGMSVETAMEKAANRTAAIINRLAGYRLDAPIPTPFPEAKSS